MINEDFGNGEERLRKIKSVVFHGIREIPRVFVSKITIPAGVKVPFRWVFESQA